jgi:hypothetical protein
MQYGGPTMLSLNVNLLHIGQCALPSFSHSRAAPLAMHAKLLQKQITRCQQFALASIQPLAARHYVMHLKLQHAVISSTYVLPTRLAALGTSESISGPVGLISNSLPLVLNAVQHTQNGTVPKVCNDRSIAPNVLCVQLKPSCTAKG